MPYVFEPAPATLIHNGIGVYPTYQNDDGDNGYVSDYWFTMVPWGASDGDAFDVRALKTAKGMPCTSHADVRAVLVAAIDAGELAAPDDAGEPLDRATWAKNRIADYAAEAGLTFAVRSRTDVERHFDRTLTDAEWDRIRVSEEWVNHFTDLDDGFDRLVPLLAEST
jgi:hypothetical protein